MKKILAFLLVICMMVLVGCGSNQSTSSSNNSKQQTTTTTQNLKDLKNTENFTEQALHHIFEGEINKRNKVVGYHYEGIASAKAHVEEGTRTKPDSHGVYNGKVYIDKQLKDGNNGYSTFYPKDWTAQQVIDAINYAWAHKEKRTDAQYTGKTKEGIVITFYLDDKTGKIATAYPNKEK